MDQAVDVPPREDNSLARLIGLSDAVFAIALTLLVLDLKVPDLDTPTNAMLMHELRKEVPSFLSYLLSFYIVASYWLSHREVLKSVTVMHPQLIRHTLPLLLLVSVLPFPTSLLGRYASEPFSFVIYAGVNVAALAMVLLLQRDVRALGLADKPADRRIWVREEWARWLDIVVYLLCVPAGYLFGARGSLVFLLLLAPRFAPQRWRRRTTA